MKTVKILLLAAALIVIVLIGLYPPYHAVVPLGNYGAYINHFLGYHSIFHPPVFKWGDAEDVRRYYDVANIDVALFIAQVATVLIVLGVGWFLAHSMSYRKSKQ